MKKKEGRKKQDRNKRKRERREQIRRRGRRNERMAKKINVERKDVREWLATLSEAARGEKNKALFADIHSRLSVPTRQRKRGAISVFKLSNVTEEGDNVIIPRKIISSGKMSHKINIAALEYSKGAKEALAASGSKIMTLKEMMSQKRIRLIV